MLSTDHKPLSPPSPNSGRRDNGSRPSPPRSEPVSSADPDCSVIGNDLTLLGEKITIVSQKKLRVDGDVRGNVHGRQVVITEGGAVHGTVSAEHIEVHGTVRGSIRAVTVSLGATAVVEGDIVQHSLTLSEGAQFDGRVARAKTTEELMPVLDPEAIASGRA